MACSIVLRECKNLAVQLLEGNIPCSQADGLIILSLSFEQVRVFRQRTGGVLI